MSATESHSDYEGTTSSVEGVLPEGRKFAVPATISVVRSLFMPRCYSSPFMLVWLATCVATICSIALFAKGLLPSGFFAAQFVFWRLGYNVGIGAILHYQSKSRAFQRWVEAYVLRSSLGKRILEQSVTFRDSKVPRFEVKNYPTEFSSWMVFRFVVNIILANDLIAYLVFVAVNWIPADVTSVAEAWQVAVASIQAATFVDLVLTFVGLGLIVFALWSKSDAHRVIGDYAWYWGDFFFLLDQKLTFDGIFEMFPHPMYTVGYAFMYGFSLLTRSHTVFYWSVFGHLAQLIFLTWVENPHIDKTYKAEYSPEELDEVAQQEAVLYDDEKGYFDKKELVVLRNFNLFRASDIIVLVCMAYATAVWWMAPSAVVVVAQYLFWRLFHTLGLGWALKEQSTSSRWTTYFNGSRKAFDSWKVLYNTVVTVTNYTFLLVAMQSAQENIPYLVAGDDWRVTVAIVGFLLIGINVWVTLGVYDVVGDYGYYYGDFFIDDCPKRLAYSGVYRYLNNPDTILGCAWYYGIACISYDLTVLGVALLTHALIKLFEVTVEAPHMRRKYGAQVRRNAGLQKALKDRTRTLKDAFAERKRRARLEYERSIARLKEETEKRRVAYETLSTKLDENGRRGKARKRNE